MTASKIGNLQALRGVAVSLVLARHVSVMEDRYAGSPGFLPSLFNAGAGGVDLFFVISGFIMVFICRDRHQQPGAFRDFLYRRATRVYPLYWFFTFIVLGIWLVKPAWVNSSIDNQTNLFASFLLLPQKLPPLVGQGWTLVYELYFYLVFAFSLLLPRSRLPIFLGVWAGVLVLGWWLVVPILPDDGAEALHVAFSPLAAEFLFGAGSALLIHRTGPRAGMACFVVGCLGVAAIVGSPDDESYSVDRVLLRALPMLALVHGAVAIELQSKILLPRFLRVIGDAAFSIYLSHILAISVVGRLWAALPVSGWWANVTVTLLMTTATLVVGIGCYHLVELPLLRLAQQQRRWRPEPRAANALPTDLSPTAGGRTPR